MNNFQNLHDDIRLAVTPRPTNNPLSPRRSRGEMRAATLTGSRQQQQLCVSFGPQDRRITELSNQRVGD